MLFRGREFLSQDLDRDEPMQRDVAGEEYDAHPAASELTDDLILCSEMRRDLLALPRHR